MRGQQGVTFPLRTTRAGVLSEAAIDALHDAAAERLAALGDAVYERLGTTCARDLHTAEPMQLADVAVALGMTKQAVHKIERRALAKMRASDLASEIAADAGAKKR